jgi:hypothetical protein
MTELVKFDIDGGGSVIVAVDDHPEVSRVSRIDQVNRQARLTFNKALGEVRDAASAALAQFQAMTNRPDEVEISFGVQLTAETGAVIARTGVQGHLQVTVRWQRSPTEPLHESG